MLRDSKIISLVEHNITYFPNTEIRALSNEIISYYHKYKTINIADFISYISDKESEMKLFNNIMNLQLKDNYLEEEIDDYIKVVNSYPIKKKNEELKNKIKNEKDPIEQAKLLNELLLSLRGVKEW